MSCMVRSPIVQAQIRGPLARRDLPGLYARVCALLAEAAGGVLLCDISGIAIDAVAVEALARLQLGARRHGARVRIKDAPAELSELLELFGLAEVLAA
jgi:ABC-type transporter Mla MlaB component